MQSTRRRTAATKRRWTTTIGSSEGRLDRWTAEEGERVVARQGLDQEGNVESRDEADAPAEGRHLPSEAGPAEAPATSASSSGPRAPRTWADVDAERLGIDLRAGGGQAAHDGHDGRRQADMDSGDHGGEDKAMGGVDHLERQGGDQATASGSWCLPGALSSFSLPACRQSERDAAGTDCEIALNAMTATIREVRTTLVAASGGDVALAIYLLKEDDLKDQLTRHTDDAIQMV